MEGCRLCPRECGAARSKGAGFCGAGEKLRAARIAPHFWLSLIHISASREFARQLPIVVVEMLPYHKMPDNGCYFVLQRLINQRPEGAAAEQKQRGGEAKPAA